MVSPPRTGVTATEMAGGAVTVKVTPLLATLFTVTTTFALPTAADAGTDTEILVVLQFVGVAAIPLNVTVLVPCAALKFVPVMFTGDPTAPDAGFKLEIVGAVLLPLTAALNAAKAEPQLALADRVVVAAAPPAAAWI